MFKSPPKTTENRATVKIGVSSDGWCGSQEGVFNNFRGPCECHQVLTTGKTDLCGCTRNDDKIFKEVQVPESQF